MYPRAKVKTDLIDDFMKQYNGKMRMSIGTAPVFILKTGTMGKKERINCVENVINAIYLLIDR